jgi:hypothetical protein
MTPKRYRFVYVGRPTAHAFFQADLQVCEHYAVSAESPDSVTASAGHVDGQRGTVATVPNTTLEQVEGDEPTD